MDDSNLIVNWLNGKGRSVIRVEVQKTQYMTMDRTNVRPVCDHLDTFQHIYRDWNQKADHSTHVAREKCATWNSFVMREDGGKCHVLSSSNWTHLF